MMKRFFWLFGIVLIICLGLAVLGFYVSSSSRPLEWFLTRSINRENPDFQVSGLKIARFFLTSERAFVMQGVSAELHFKDQKGLVKLDEVTVFNPSQLLEHQEAVRIDFLGGQLEADGLRIKEARSRLTHLSREKSWQAAGSVFIFGLNLAGKQLKNVSFDFKADEKRIDVFKFDSSLSEGKIKGDFNLAFDGTLPYNLGLIIEQVPASFFDFESFKMDKQMKGAISGHLTMRGDNRRIEAVDAQFQAPQGMYVNAKALSPLLNYIPQSVQRKSIEQIIAQGQNIFLDKFTLDVTNEKNNMLKTNFDLKSIAYNLDVNLGVDINVDGGLHSLLEQGISYFPKKDAPEAGHR